MTTIGGICRLLIPIAGEPMANTFRMTYALAQPRIPPLRPMIYLAAWIVMFVMAWQIFAHA